MDMPSLIRDTPIILQQMQSEQYREAFAGIARLQKTFPANPALLTLSYECCVHLGEADEAERIKATLTYLNNGKLPENIKLLSDSFRDAHSGLTDIGELQYPVLGRRATSCENRVPVLSAA